MGDLILRRLLRFPGAEQKMVSSVNKMEKMVWIVPVIVLPKHMLPRNI